MLENSENFPEHKVIIKLLFCLNSQKSKDNSFTPIKKIYRLIISSLLMCINLIT